MTVVTVGHHPELTPAKAMAVFQQYLGSSYQVYRADSWPSSTNMVKRDFAIKKSSWIGISVKLEQGRDKTSFIVTHFVPSFLVVTFGGVFAMLFLRSRFKALEAEIISFIETAQEFR